MKRTVIDSLFSWYRENARSLPWRGGERNPYAVWVSEIMLQQTRVQTVIPYFEKFMERFPDVQKLAEAEEEEVLNYWEGLGFYARARNLHRSARIICEQHDSEVPDTEEELLALPGIGPATAGAILSFAFERPHPVLDGNVCRVLSRFYGIESVPDTSSRGSEYRSYARDVNQKASSGLINEAFIELGAVICTASSPDCENCPIQKNCYAFEKEKVDEFPPKNEPSKTPVRDYVGIAPVRNGELLLVRRPSEGLLGGMWEVPMRRNDAEEDYRGMARKIGEWLLESPGVIEGPIGKVNHIYSHFELQMPLFVIFVRNEVRSINQETRWVEPSALTEVPVHNAAKKAIELTRKIQLFSPNESNE